MEEINTYDYYDEVFTNAYFLLSLRKQLIRIEKIMDSNEKNLNKENLEKFFNTSKEIKKIKDEQRKIDSSSYNRKTAEHCWADMLKGIYIKSGLDKEIIEQIEDYMNRNICLLNIL